MNILIDKIRLRGPEHEADFVRWVTEVDYAACTALPSVRRFQVVRAAPDAGFDFFEIVHVSSLPAFQDDMQTPVFKSLVQRFTQMAEVNESFSGALLPPGFDIHG